MPFIAIANALALMLCAQNPNQVIDLHVESLARIKSIYVKLEVWGPSLESNGKPKGGPVELKKGSVSESWRAGLRERTVQRVYSLMGPGGITEDPNGDVTIRGLSDKEVRDIRGWDPEMPYPLPLDFAKHAGDFARVKCSLAKRNPVPGGSFDWFRILFDILPGFSLAKAAEVSEIVWVPSSVPGVIRLEVKASGMARLVGMKIDLDPEHGHLIRQITWKDGGMNEVKGFSQLGDGIWIPKRVRSSSKPFATTVEVVDCRVNSPISDADLDVNFPEGARVDEPEKGLIHLWGKDGPVKTFSKDTDFFRYLEEYARQVQAAGGTAPSAWRVRPLLLLVNAVLVGLFVLLVILRKRLAKRPSPLP